MATQRKKRKKRKKTMPENEEKVPSRGRERRRAQRVAMPLLKVTYQAADVAECCEAACVDISALGIRLVTARPFLPGEVIHLKIFPKKDIPPFDIDSRVIWCKEKTEKDCEIGAKFIKIDRKEDFRIFVCEQLTLHCSK